MPEAVATVQGCRLVCAFHKDRLVRPWYGSLAFCLAGMSSGATSRPARDSGRLLRCVRQQMPDLHLSESLWPCVVGYPAISCVRATQFQAGPWVSSSSPWVWVGHGPLTISGGGVRHIKSKYYQQPVTRQLRLLLRLRMRLLLILVLLPLERNHSPPKFPSPQEQ